MPPPERAMAKQWAVLWEPTGFKDRNGKVLVSTVPSEIRVRWVDKKRNTLDKEGNTIAIDATIVANQEVPENSILWKGKVDDIPGTSLVPEEGLVQVVVANRIPDVKGRVREYELMCMRYNSALPTS